MKRVALPLGRPLSSIGAGPCAGRNFAEGPITCFAAHHTEPMILVGTFYVLVHASFVPHTEFWLHGLLRCSVACRRRRRACQSHQRGKEKGGRFASRSMLGVGPDLNAAGSVARVASLSSPGDHHVQRAHRVCGSSRLFQEVRASGTLPANLPCVSWCAQPEPLRHWLHGRQDPDLVPSPVCYCCRCQTECVCRSLRRDLNTHQLRSTCTHKVAS